MYIKIIDPYTVQLFYVGDGLNLSEFAMLVNFAFVILHCKIFDEGYTCIFAVFEKKIGT